MWKPRADVEFRQQGDVLMQEASKCPVDWDEVPKVTRAVVAEGETTGHAHAVAVMDMVALGIDVDKIDLRIREVDGVTYLRALGPPEMFPLHLRHEEHAPITSFFAPGVQESWRVQEYDHLAEEARIVCD